MIEDLQQRGPFLWQNHILRRDEGLRPYWQPKIKHELIHERLLVCE